MGGKVERSETETSATSSSEALRLEGASGQMIDGFWVLLEGGYGSGLLI